MIDITREIIALYDKAHPLASGPAKPAAPAPSKPAATTPTPKKQP
jgi:hypothetical protein